MNREECAKVLAEFISDICVSQHALAVDPEAIAEWLQHRDASPDDTIFSLARQYVYDEPQKDGIDLDDVFECHQLCEADFDMERPIPSRPARRSYLRLISGVRCDSSRRVAVISTDKGEKTAQVGEWLVKTKDGNLRVVSPGTPLHRWDPTDPRLV